jgi:cell division protein FtsB
MNKEVICLVVALVLGAVVIVGFVAQDIYLANKIRKLAKQNERLRRENIGLMRHNGKLYDENRELKSITEENIPDFKPW